jgi:AraC-like DNA-binding protein
MNFSNLNPTIHTVALYEKLDRTEPCIAPDSKIIYLISGELTYTVGDGKRERLSPGKLLYIPAGTVYRLKSKYMRAVVVSFDFTDEFGGEGKWLAPVVAESGAELQIHTVLGIPVFEDPLVLEDVEAERDNLIRMANIFTSAEGFYLAELSAMLKLLLIKIAEHSDESALPSSMVENLDGYIRDNIHDEISNTELGAIFGYHPFYISRVLKDKRGITLHQYVIAYRIKYAMSLLRYTDKAIADIADETGFTDASYFTKSFKAQFGMTPKEYRNKFKEDFI